LLLLLLLPVFVCRVYDPRCFVFERFNQYPKLVHQKSELALQDLSFLQSRKQIAKRCFFTPSKIPVSH